MRRISVALAVMMIAGMVTSARAIVINEFMYNTEGGNAFIELFNRTIYNGHPSLWKDVNINGWKIELWDGATNYKTITIDAPTTLTPGQYILIASQDVFIEQPDQEIPFTIMAGSSTNVRGIILKDKSNQPTDTVLYAANPAPGINFGTLVDDAGKTDPTRVLNTTLVPNRRGSGTQDTLDADAVKAISIRRRAALGSLEDTVPGTPPITVVVGGIDSNNAALDFMAAGPGFASPHSRTTPVTLSVFEAR
ncbi:MAG: lamin tail domain-containing protein [Candidatus Sumerlaeota bacterium]|nr:lamin tail domain-containing protein [Candidatus Sumerlaeota bacterium]